MLHLLFEQTVGLSIDSLVALTGIGIGPLALATLAWDAGIRRGDARTLAVAAYMTPVVSAGLLVAIGYAVLSVDLVVAAVLVAAAGLVSSLGGRQTSP